MEEMLLNFVAWGLAKFPVAVSLFAIMGFLRSFNKLLQPFLKEVVKLTPSEKDDAFLDKVLSSKYYAVFVYWVDYLSSIKLPKLEKKDDK